MKSAAPLVLAFLAACGPDATPPTPKAPEAWSEGRYASGPGTGRRPEDERIRRAEDFVRQERYAEAATEYRTLLNENPKSAPALAGLSHVAARMGDVPGAMSFINRALEIQPDEGGFVNQLGVTLVMARRREEAAGVFEKAIALRPDDPLIYLNAALNEADLGHWTKAEQFARQGADRMPQDATPWVILGRLQVRQGRHAEAVAPFKEAARRAPDNAIVNYHLGKALSAAGRRAEAEGPLQAALKGNPPPPAETRKEIEALLAGR